MEYKGYELEETAPGTLLVKGVRDFDPVHVFECGQCFRWRRQADGSYTGVAMGRVINLKSTADGSRGVSLLIRNTDMHDFTEIWFDYFDLGRDYGRIKGRITKDAAMVKAVAFGAGIRLLKQDIWETAISFIFSTNKKIPMIADIIESVSRTYGKAIKYGGETYYTFPDVCDLAEADLERLKECKGGYRCGYASGTARTVAETSALLNRGRLSGMSLTEAREILMDLPGVGPKVADCILLYSGTRYDVFPTDVWVKRVMAELYFKRETGFKEIHNFAASYFGADSGFAQQYLFYYARELRVKLS